MKISFLDNENNDIEKKRKKEDNIFLFNNTNKIRERILIIMNISKQAHTEILESPPFLSSSFFTLQKSVAKLFIQRLTSCILFYPVYHSIGIMEEKVMVHKLQGEWWNIEAPFKHTDKSAGKLRINVTVQWQ